ncbi:MAG TPA: hypothetical protein VK701_04765 [Solirubrobacteraceae bacterium]|nr:hypothetical protein [Solirubrobacteraceae bacterium]
MAATSGLLARYLDADGRTRELLTLPGHGGSVLVLDRDAATLCDRMLVAHLAADEPHANAELICRHYIEDTSGRWCRHMCSEDLEIAPLGGGSNCLQHDSAWQDGLIKGRDDNVYRISLVQSQRSIRQLRWCRGSTGSGALSWDQTSLREVVGAVESYDPARTLTEQAIARHREDPGISVTRLRSEFDRVCCSPLVLNRRLREAVLDAVDSEGVSMSEIALRCGIVKRDRRGKVSGETSWLARRIGIMPKGGEKAITPWIHSDVLAAIARKGLRISPREVEIQ